ncbi:putative disease resistance protein RGA3 [Syzygium oleosum]|uniref:putative disease resistance protein RGA3 n=1 Tax=Syzygium oleosum TaxID=219896 RepID=UPI0024BA3E97|nr:putative disease resistance protein RGA3 [Syzygium oleosum]
MKLITRHHQTIVSQQKHHLCNLLSNTPQPLAFAFLEMAEAALFSIATAILESIATEIAKPGGSFASQEIQLLCGAKDELKSLEDTVQTIQAVLLDAEKKQWHDNQVKLWLRRLKDVLYDVQDLFDDVATENLRWKVTSGNKMSKANLSSLQKLSIHDCWELDLLCQEDEHGTQWRFLTKLRVLKIRYVWDLVELPKGIQHVTTLQSLEISYCQNLESLPEWIENFSLLEKLVLSYCPKLERLPLGMRNLTRLKDLRICDCPALKERYLTDGHEELEKIAHIRIIDWED